MNYYGQIKNNKSRSKDGLQKEDIGRPEGEIDVLIGFEYAGFHPVREQSSGHVCKNADCSL